MFDGQRPKYVPGTLKCLGVTYEVTLPKDKAEEFVKGFKFGTFDPIVIEGDKAKIRVVFEKEYMVHQLQQYYCMFCGVDHI